MLPCPAASFFRPLLAALLALVTLLLAPNAGAQAAPLALEGVPGGVLSLTVGKGGHEGSFAVRNTGSAPLPVRVRLATSDEDVRLPPGISVAFENRSQDATLTPGEARKVQVLWTPSRGKAREVYGHIALDANGTTTYLGLHGELGLGFSGLLARRVLSLLLALPLLGALAALGFVRSSVPAVLTRLPRAVAAVHLALVTWLLVNLERDFGRLDGNEGLQYIERGPVGPVEVFLGADGASVLVAWVLAAAFLAGSFLLPGGALAALALSVVGLTLASFSQDLAALWVGWAVGLGGLVILGGKERLRTFGGLALVSLGALGAFAGVLRGAAGGALLLDGREVVRSLALPALLRSDFLVPGRTALGLPLAAGAFVLLCAGTLPLAGAWLGGGWLRSARTSPGASLLAGGIVAVAVHTLLRLGAQAVPEGVVWASTTLSWGGAALALLGGLGAWGEQEEEARFPWWMSAQVGLALIGVGSGTPQGMVGALFGVAAGAVGWLLARGEEEGSWSGGLGGLVAAGVPGLVGFWGPAVGLLGALTRVPGAAGVGTVGWAVAVGAAARGWRGGQGRGRGWGGVLLVLGVWPGGVLGAMERWGLDQASYLRAPGPTWVAVRSSFSGGRGGGYGGEP